MHRFYSSTKFRHNYHLKLHFNKCTILFTLAVLLWVRKIKKGKFVETNDDTSKEIYCMIMKMGWKGERRGTCMLSGIRTWIKFVINIGNIESGNRRMLNNERETKAFVASRSPSATRTYVAKLDKATCYRPPSHNIKLRDNKEWKSDKKERKKEKNCSKIINLRGMNLKVQWIWWDGLVNCNFYEGEKYQEVPEHRIRTFCWHNCPKAILYLNHVNDQEW